MTQFRFTPERYDEWVRKDVPAYDELQERVARATADLEVERILELGIGTGEAARHLLDLHPRARLTGIDASADMLERARDELPGERLDALAVSRLEDPLPSGPFELVVSVLAVHHLHGPGKAELFARVADLLEPGGRFVLGDVVVPGRPEDAVTPVSAGFDFPDRAEDQVGWLEAVGLSARLEWSRGDLAILVADR